MDYQTFHRYNRLARRGLVKPLAHSCGNEFTLTIGDDEEESPVLKCYFCNTTTYPGTKMFADIQAVVQEWFT